jgi:predicted DsbA family dithiol-disulfide isomerase
VPTFVSYGKGVVGAQPYEVLEQLMAAVGAEKRAG